MARLTITPSSGNLAERRDWTEILAGLTRNSEFIASYSEGIEALCAPCLYDPHCGHEAVQLIARVAAARNSPTLLSYEFGNGGWKTTLNCPLHRWKVSDLIFGNICTSEAPRHHRARISIF